MVNSTNNYRTLDALQKESISEVKLFHNEKPRFTFVFGYKQRAVCA